MTSFHHAAVTVRHFDAHHYSRVVFPPIDALDALRVWSPPTTSRSEQLRSRYPLLRPDGPGCRCYAAAGWGRGRRDLRGRRALPDGPGTRPLQSASRSRPPRAAGADPAGAAGSTPGSSVGGQRYVRRARIPNPQRFYSYEFYVAQNVGRLLHPDFLASIVPEAPWAILVRHFDRVRASAELNRLLYLDLKLTIGDNDLLKVTRTAEVAGVGVRFPLLALPLVEFTGSWPAEFKVRRAREAPSLQACVPFPPAATDIDEEEAGFWSSYR